MPASYPDEVEVIIMPWKMRESDKNIKAKLDKFFSDFNIVLKNYKFNREEANER